LDTILKNSALALHQIVWQNCLAIIRLRVDAVAFQAWFEPVLPVSLIDNVLVVQVPSRFFCEWLDENYLDVLREVINAELGPGGRLVYNLPAEPRLEMQPMAVSIPPGAINSHNNGNHRPNGPTNFNGFGAFSMGSPSQVAKTSHLNPSYTFANYVEGDFNRFPLACAHAVADRPGGTTYNPYLVYGDVGLGKTHLVQAIGNAIIERDASKIVIYTSSINFVNQFIEATKDNSVKEFNHFYLQVDVLILDDVQFLADKEKSQEIFFHIFNHLKQNGKQIILTSDRPPNDLKGLQERLISRLKWGLSLPIAQPDFETRMAILLRKMEIDGTQLPRDVVEYLAKVVHTNIRELEGVYITMTAHASLLQHSLDLTTAKQILQNLVADIDKEISVDSIQRSVSDHFRIPLDALKAKSRTQDVVQARHVAMYFAKELTNSSLKAIGSQFGGRDHSTVIHAVKTVQHLMEQNARYKATIEDLLKKLKN
jgi:chromosomal replication initiator protein